MQLGPGPRLRYRRLLQPSQVVKPSDVLDGVFFDFSRRLVDEQAIDLRHCRFVLLFSAPFARLVLADDCALFLFLVYPVWGLK